MKQQTKKIVLNNGVEIPMFGLGTFTLTPDEAENSVIVALQNGYELIDTANAYVNEKAVGRGIKKSNVSRDRVFLETKLWPVFYEDETAIDKTLERLGVDYVDLMILHQPAGNYISGYKLLEKAYKEKKVRAIGLSNFTIEMIEEILNSCEVVPALIQVECHPYYPQEELKEYLKKYNIALQSWYPLGHGDSGLLTNEVITEIAKKYHKTNAQVLLRWQIDMGNVVIPGSRSKEHILQNIDIFDFALDQDDLKNIASINKNTPYYNQTEESLNGFANWHPDVEGQK